MNPIQKPGNRWLALATLLLVATASLGDEIPSQLPAVDGVIGFGESDGQTWFTVWVTCPESQALEGVLWYNNDELVVFPSVLVGTGYADGPGAVEDMVVVMEAVSGLSSAWSSLTFGVPIAASQGGLYVTFTLPEGVACDGLGEGGGPGFGYSAGMAETEGWMSRNGESWFRLHRSSDFALVPVLVPFEDGMLVKSLGEDEPSGEVPPAKPFLSVGPNPFNPRTEIRLGVPRNSHVKIDIYDVRGYRVIRLIDGPLKAGRHSITWNGVDGADRGVASGVYFAHMTVGNNVLIRKMALVR